MQLSGAALSAVNVQNTHQGIYNVAMSCTLAGTFSLNIRKLNKVSNQISDIADSPFVFSVSPGSVAPDNTVITGQSPLGSPVVGNKYFIFIQQYDLFGNKVIESGSGIISGSLNKAVAGVGSIFIAAETQYLGNGSFALSFLPTISGQYSVSIKYGSKDIGAARSLRSPFLVHVFLLQFFLYFLCSAKSKF
jgi:hypothetical protein